MTKTQQLTKVQKLEEQMSKLYKDIETNLEYIRGQLDNCLNWFDNDDVSTTYELHYIIDNVNEVIEQYEEMEELTQKYVKATDN